MPAFTHEESLLRFNEFMESDNLVDGIWRYEIECKLPICFLNNSTSDSLSSFLTVLTKKSLMVQRYQGKFALEPSSICGLYAIYRNNECLYVGMSRNLGKRLNDHIIESRRFLDFDKIVCFFAEARLDHHEWSRDVESNAMFTVSDTDMVTLFANENILIDLLQPTENIKRPKPYYEYSRIFNLFSRAKSLSNPSCVVDSADFIVSRDNDEILIKGGLKYILETNNE